MLRRPIQMTTRSNLARWVGVAISFVALFLVLQGIDLGAALAIMTEADAVPIALAVGIVGVQVSLTTQRWRILLPRLPDGSMVPFGHAIRYQLVGYLGNFVLPARMGELIRSYLVARYEAMPFAQTVGTAVVERIIDTATLAVMAFVVAVTLAAQAWVIQVTGLVAALCVVLVVVLATIGPEPVVRLLHRVVGARGGRRVATLLTQVDRFMHGLSPVHRRASFAWAVALSVIGWLLEATIFWLVARAIGVSLSPPEAMLIAGVTILVTAVPSAPGYVGTYELAATAVATSLGIDPDAAFALAVLVHATTLLPLAVGGAISLASLGGGLRRYAAGAVELEQAEERDAASG
jgi:glycosyltransferase 2 family protein